MDADLWVLGVNAPELGKKIKIAKLVQIPETSWKQGYYTRVKSYVKE